MRMIYKNLISTSLIVFLVVFAFSLTSHSDTFTVNTTDNGNDGVCEDMPAGDCTFQEAIDAAGANAGLDDIVFDPALDGGGGIIFNTNGQRVFNDGDINVNCQNTQAVTFDRGVVGPPSRVMRVEGGIVTICGTTNYRWRSFRRRC